MLVVSDASPINILIRLGHADVLAALFTSVVIPPSVAEEMGRAATPEIVRHWMARPPAWLSIRAPTNPEPALEPRHRGERDAIRLAQELHADAILLDEEKPRMHAASVGLRVIGTVGILELAANRGYIPDLKATHERLRQTDFYIDCSILDDSLARHLEYNRLEALKRSCP
jgi:predicted nucleic acid-binding protein